MFSRRKPRFAILFSAFLLTTPLIVASPAVAAAPSTFLALDLPVGSTNDPEKIIAAGLSRLAEQLNELPNLDGLQDAIPLSDKTLADALGLVDRFNDLKTEMDALVSNPDELTTAALKMAIEDAGGSGLTLTPAFLTPNGDIIPMTLGFSITKAVNIPFSAGDGFPVSGGSVDGMATLTGSLAFELDTSMFATDLDNSFYILTSPTPSLTLEVAAGVADLGSLPGQLGFSAVDISGSASFNLDAALTITDPDTTPPSNGKITFDEYDSTAILDLVSFAVVHTGDDVANVNLTIDSSLIGAPGSDDGSFSYVLANLGDTPNITSSLGDLADFENFTLAEAVAAFDRLAALLGGLQTTRRLDVELPLVGGGINDVINLEDRIRDALAAMVTEKNDGEDNDNDGMTDEEGEDPIVPNFASAQELEPLLESITGIGDVTIAHSGDVLTYTFEVTGSDSKTVYVGNTPPPSEDDPLRLRFPDLDILNNVEITTGANATLNADYKLDLIFGFDLTVQPEEGGAGHGSCFDGLDNDLDGDPDAADSDCEDALSLIDRVFLDVGDVAGTPEGTASATLTASNIDATATVGILEVGVTDATVAINGPAETDNQARVTVDFFDADDGRLTVGDLFDVLGDSPMAPPMADVETKLVADFAATVPVSATVGATNLLGGSITMTSSVDGPVTDVGQLITDLTVNGDDLGASDIFNFSPCSNNIDDDGDGVINDGCPGSGVPANDAPESESTASLTQIIAAVRSFAQGLEGQFAAELETPIPLVGKTFGDLVDFADVILAAAEDLENPAESDGSLDGGPDCANEEDDDGDGFTNDGCPTVGDAPEGGGLASATSEHCSNDDDDDADGFANDGCRAVNPGLAQIGMFLEKALTEALEDAVGQVLTPTVGVTIAYNSGPNDVTIELDLDLAFTEMTSFSIDLGTAIGDQDLVGVESAGDLGIDLTAHLDLDFGIDLDDVTPFMLGSSGFSLTAQADATDLQFAANIGPIEFQVGAPGDEGEIHIGAEFAVDVDAADATRVPFSGLSFTSTPFAGVDQAACPADPGDTPHDSEHDACAILPLYLNDVFLDDIVVKIHDLTDLSSADAVEVAFPDPARITDAITGQLLEFALMESGLGRLIENLKNLLVDGLLAVDIPLIGDEVDQIANFIDGLDQNGLLGAIIAGEDPIELALAAVSNEQDVWVELDPGVTPVNEEQEISHAGDGGTFTLTFNGTETADLDFDADANAVDTALEATVTGTDNFEVTGSSPWTVEFVGSLEQTDVDPITGDAGSLDNATDIDVTTTVPGVSGGTFTLTKPDQGPSDPIPWDATATEIEDALTASGTGITAVSASGTGTVGDPWVLTGFTPTNPGKLKVDDDLLEGSAFVDTLIPTVADVQAELVTFTSGLKQALFAAGLLLDGGTPTQTAPAIGDGVTELMVTCDGGCNDADPATTIDGIRFDILLGQVGQADAEIDFDVALPGLDLATDAKPGVSGTWRLDLGFGINKDVGFFVDTSTEDELFVGAEAFLTDPADTEPATIEGRIAFIGINIRDGNEGLNPCAAEVDPDAMCSTDDDGDGTLPTSRVQAQFTIDIVDPKTKADDGMFTFGEMTAAPSVDKLISAKIQAAADLNLHLESMIAATGASLPRIYADLQLSFCWARDLLAGDNTLTMTRSDGGDFNFTGQDCGDILWDVELLNTALDAGSFVTSFLQPILSDVQQFTRPLQPVIDTLNEPIPVLSDLGAGPVTLLSLAEALGPADNKYDLIFQLVKLVDFINKIDTDQDRLIIPLAKPGAGNNDYSLDVGRLTAGPISSEQAKEAFTTPGDLPDASMTTGGGDLDFNMSTSSTAQSPSDLKSDVGVSFPFLEEPAKVLGMLFGQDVDLVTWTPKPLSFGFSYSQRFGPIWAVPPVFLEVGGSVSVTGRFGIGYDTQGLREILFEDAGPEAILHGVFLLDRDASGRDVNELEVKGELFANAQVSVLIFSAGAGGSVYATIGIDLQDPNSDGKLKFQEIADIIRSTGNPFCIFNLNGAFGVRIFVFAEVDLFFWSKRWSKTLADIVLYEFKIECDGLREPVLAVPNGGGAPAPVSGDELRLNLGKHRSGRDAKGASVGGQEKLEEFTVTQEADGSLTVEAFGFSQNYEAPADGTWDYVWADGGTDGVDEGDKIFLLDGGDEAPTEEGDLDAAQSQFTAAAVFIGSDGDDTYITGAGNDVIDAKGGADVIDTRDGNDAVEGGAGNDAITGGAGNDDELNGGPGADYIDGGPGADTINGGTGDDELLGGADRKRSETETLPDGIDTIHGDEGDDDIDGGPGNDELFGDEDRDTIRGGEGDDTISGGDGGNETACPTDNAGPGAGSLPPGGDVLYGGPGTDTIYGNGGDDIIIGGLSIDDSPDTNDNLFGEAGCDSIYGDNVEIDEDGNVIPQVTSNSDLFGGDTMKGGTEGDVLIGQGGNDNMAGDDGADVLKGNDGNDTMWGDDSDGVAAGDGADVMNGNDGNDTMRGGGANDDMFGDDGEDTMFGNDGDDFMRGGRQNDTMSGNADSDEMFGDSGNDLMWGDANTAAPGDGPDEMRGGIGDDYMFGNAGGDDMRGDSGNDRMVGGNDDPDKADNSAPDRDEMRGGSGADVMAGDNATISEAGAHCHACTLDGEGDGDDMFGDTEADRMFGQTGDDDMYGGGAGDYMEGNDGSDKIRGEDGDDDLIGGGSANAASTARSTSDRIGDGLPDEADEIWGGDGEDWIAGDNARIDRNFDLGDTADLVLFDVNPAVTTTSGGDRIEGNGGHDAIFGQGNGAQDPEDQGDAPDGNVDNDLDGEFDEDGGIALGGTPFLGDIIWAGAGNDYVEGNHGADLIYGESGEDDLIGGGSSEASVATLV